MKIAFPAMRARMGGRTYFATTMALSEVPKFFRFNDIESMTPELRAQRTLNATRVPEISKYITENEDSYLFSSITCSHSGKLEFISVSNEEPDLGTIRMELEDMEFIINDGQHRCAAIAHAIQENPELGSHRISVLLFPMENLERMQQMFSDLNRHANRSSKSLNILYDHRDPLGSMTRECIERVHIFRDKVDFEKASIPLRSHKMFTLTSLYDANTELFARTKIVEEGTQDYAQQLEQAVAYWTEVTKNMKDWRLAAEGTIPPAAIRQEKICTHSVVLRALGSIGNILLEHYPDEWRQLVKPLSDIDWRKSVGNKVNPLWNDICISAGSVVSNKQARIATFNKIIECLGLDPKKIISIKSGRRGRPKKDDSSIQEDLKGGEHL
ncbi:MAG: DNA sulfur modification protein DndB [Pseudomonadota bacterium]